MVNTWMVGGLDNLLCDVAGKLQVSLEATPHSAAMLPCSGELSVSVRDAQTVFREVLEASEVLGSS